MSSPFIIIDEITSKINEMNTSLTTKIDNLIGATGNTGGTASAGTVMAKLNAIITNTTTNNTASNTGALSQKLSYISNSLIGATGNTGGTASAGTAMAKLNATISNTAATTTENSSGTLSAKLTYLINRRDRIYSPSSTNLKTLTTSLKTADTKRGTTSNSTSTRAYSDYTPYTYACFDGIYRVYCTGTATVVNLENQSSYGPSARNSLYCEVYVNDTIVNTFTIATQGASIGTSAAATKTVDIVLKKADKVRCRLYAFSEYYDADEHPCTSDWRAGNQMNGTATDISIRGSIKEVSSIFY